MSMKSIQTEAALWVVGDKHTHTHTDTYTSALIISRVKKNRSKKHHLQSYQVFLITLTEMRHLQRAIFGKLKQKFEIIN